jgi:hypothetical protein
VAFMPPWRSVSLSRVPIFISAEEACRRIRDRHSCQQDYREDYAHHFGILDMRIFLILFPFRILFAVLRFFEYARAASPRIQFSPLPIGEPALCP